MKRSRSPLFIAIVGGSGAGKSWLADQLATALCRMAARISLDDFYRDRSRVSPRLRCRINFDHPRAIDWLVLERVMDDFSNGRVTFVPRYCFKTHCRIGGRRLEPRPVALVDGLWLLLRPSIRRRFVMSIFIRCDSRTRLRRRMERDSFSRGRSVESIREQFANSVEPMHARFVSPQERWADVVLRGNFGAREVESLANQLRTLLMRPFQMKRGAPVLRPPFSASRRRYSPSVHRENSSKDLRVGPLNSDLDAKPNEDDFAAIATRIDQGKVTEHRLHVGIHESAIV